MARRIAAAGIVALAAASILATPAHASSPLSVNGSARVLSTNDRQATVLLDGVTSKATDMGLVTVLYDDPYANPIRLDCVRVVSEGDRRVILASGRDPASIVGPDAHAYPNFFLKVVMQRGRADQARFSGSGTGALESCGAGDLDVRPVTGGRFLATS